MVRGSPDRQPNAIPVSPENEKQAAERRWVEDALEDDEVYEALVSLLAEKRRARLSPGRPARNS